MDYIALSRVPLEDFPERVSRIRRRKGEDVEDWRERAIEYVRKNPPKEKKVSSRTPLEERFDETLDNLKNSFRLSRADLHTFADNPPDLPALAQYTPPSIKAQSRGRTGRAWWDNLENLRRSMYLWVAATLTRKLSEANCDLDCFQCPSARVLNCAAQNQSSVQEDGITLPAFMAPMEENEHGKDHPPT